MNDILSLVINLLLLQDIKKQRATGLTKDGATFPLSVYIERASEPSKCGHDNSRICPGEVMLITALFPLTCLI